MTRPHKPDFFETFANNSQAMTVLVVVIIVLICGLFAMHIGKSGYGDR